MSNWRKVGHFCRYNGHCRHGGIERLSGYNYKPSRVYLARRHSWVCGKTQVGKPESWGGPQKAAKTRIGPNKLWRWMDLGSSPGYATTSQVQLGKLPNLSETQLSHLHNSLIYQSGAVWARWRRGERAGLWHRSQLSTVFCAPLPKSFCI